MIGNYDVSLDLSGLLYAEILVNPINKTDKIKCIDNNRGEKAQKQSYNGFLLLFLFMFYFVNDFESSKNWIDLESIRFANQFSNSISH